MTAGHLTVTRRQAYAALTLALLAATAGALAAGAPWEAVLAGAIGPDVALLLGAGRGLERGRLHPRAVPLYNALHRFAGPVALVALAPLGGAALLGGGVAWALHIALDRTVGYGLRTPEGFQRAA